MDNFFFFFLDLPLLHSVRDIIVTRQNKTFIFPHMTGKILNVTITRFVFVKHKMSLEIQCKFLGGRPDKILLNLVSMKSSDYTFIIFRNDSVKQISFYLTVQV